MAGLGCEEIGENQNEMRADDYECKVLMYRNFIEYSTKSA